eukprot:c5363_g1_i2.p2 GENE.c5363_g1_i2~~c5363_g1_i2.p2  ORF type:complete len:120 (-),score=31.82 c5363_g1_i2:89-415(-)
MGKRRSSKPPPKKKIPKLETVFDCPFCNHAKTVECKISRQKGEGSVMCRVCSVRWSTSVHDLMGPIDVYNAWIDECEEQNNNVSNEEYDDDDKVENVRRDLDSEDDDY